MTAFEKYGTAIKPPPTARGEDWRESALCAGSDDPDLWFRSDSDSMALARSICEQCPVIQECVKARIEYRAEGMWGGRLYGYRSRLSGEAS